ncbi:hypothetical protein TTHERM_00486000 (macronuclear) [Tetrahymena thermophila SB210]|uniref:Uncharacterized protein n=1 Tax=Tetrahymena thermophila (strain SB210) TaxID=312017 RepID=I7LTF5_TETTS|nr:hypothetical protein TTHERM_00486000 [Tetrahymena thermophila SB210]EAR85150.1 hypothetical protein TTHERM_00486000 [Tetrahymena thermophila SB210]|eukprot:XP_001032813.1 hypothetical protein TTHERM_00486000 [Tetrahymena thermophila SB210]
MASQLQQLQELQLQEINLNDEPVKNQNQQASKVQQLQEFTKKILSAKNNDSQMIQSLEYIKQKINFTSKTPSQFEYDGDQSFREGIKCSFLDESESNYSSVSTVASINVGLTQHEKKTPKIQYQQTLYVLRDQEQNQSSSNENPQSFIDLWSIFKQIYMQEKSLQSQCELQSRAQLNKAQNNDENEEDDNQFNIFSCLQCFKKRQLPKYLLVEKNLILYMYNTKKLSKENNSNLIQKINRFYTQVNQRVNAVLKINQEIDNLSVLSNLFLIAFSDFHSEIFNYLLDVLNQAQEINGQKKVSITKIAQIFTSDIIYLLSTSRIDNQILQRQSVINYVNNLFFALMFCYFQECVRNQSDFGEQSSKTILNALLKQVNAKPDSIVNYFTKRFPSFIIDKNFLKYI